MQKLVLFVIVGVSMLAFAGCSSGEVTTSDVNEWKNQGLSKEEAEKMPDPNADR